MQNYRLLSAAVSLMLFLSIPCPLLCAETGPVYESVFRPEMLAAKDFPTYAKALGSLNGGDAAAALAQVESAPPPRKDSAKAERVVVLAASHLALGDVKNAEQALRSYLNERPASADAIFLLALCRARQGSLEDAAGLLDEALWFSKTSFIPASAVRLETAHLYRVNNNRPKAKELLDKIAAEENPSVYALYELAQLQAEDGEKDKAAANLKKVLTANSAHGQANLLLAQIMQSTANRFTQEASCKEAKALSDKAIESGSLNAEEKKEALITKTRALICTKELDAARSVLKKLTKSYPGDPQVARLEQQLAIESGGQVG